MNGFCHCSDIIILVEGDGLNVANEIFCSIHGSQNSCYMCDPNNHTTELCRKHADMERFEQVHITSISIDKCGITFNCV